MLDRSGPKDRVVVIGGGVSGLVVARQLLQQSTCDVRLYEARNRLGGSIWTERRDGFTLEAGADSFITNKPWGVELCEELGIADRLIDTDVRNRRSFVVNRGRLMPVPEGFVMAAPTRILPILTTPVLSAAGKLRLLADLILPRREANKEESLASFVRRRFGRQALDRLVQPLVGGIYTADPNELSLQATMPQFARMEQEHRSVIRGAAIEARKNQRGAQALSSSGARYGLFTTLDDGMDLLIGALANALPTGSLHPGVAARRVSRVEPGGHWRVEMLDGTTVDAKALVLATEAHAAARLLEAHDSDLALRLRSIPYASSIVANVAYRRDAVAHPLDGFGAVVPAIENQQILAVSFTSVKFPRRAPGGTVLFRVFLGGALQPEICELDESHIERIVIESLERLLGATGTPMFIETTRHIRAMPQYTLGHLDRLAAIRERCVRNPGLYVTGNAFDGVGIPDCIRGAKDIASAVAAYLAASAKAAA